MEKLKFKKITADDAGRLCKLYYQLTGERPDLGRTEKLIGDVGKTPDHFLFGAYTDEGELIAAVSLTRCFDLTGDGRSYFSLENFIVDERYRRRGVGTFLIERTEDFIKKQDGRYVCFTSSSKREDAHLFYEALGYDPDYVKGFKKTFCAGRKETERE